MQKKTYKLYYGGNLMPWAKGTVVKNPKGIVYLAGTDPYDPNEDFRAGGRIVEGAEAQWRMCLEKIKDRLEEMGTSLENIVHMIFYVAGPFPDGVAKSPNCRFDVLDAFFREHCPTLCMDNNPPSSDLIGVSALAAKESLVEISCVAVLPD